MNKRLLPLLLLLPFAASSASAADSLYKCEGKAGISIQSDPCPPGSTQVWRRDATPETGPTPEELAARAALTQAEAERASEQARLAEQERLADEARRAAEERARIEAATDAPGRKSACTLAHEFSDAVAAKPWLRISDAQSTRLREWVAEQCRLSDAPVSL